MGSLKPLIEPALAESIVSMRGRATADGAGDGSTLIDTDLTEANDYWNDMTLLILSGDSDGQSRDITDFAGGTLTVSPAFSNQILSGVRYLILPIKPSFAEIADLDVDVANVIQQIALTGHPGDSIGKILYDFYNTRLTAARCGYLANINNANLATIADISSLTATEIGYLANINNANLATISDISSLTATEIGYLAELAAANLPSDVDDILADTGELQTDWADGGRLDLLIDAIIADIGTFPTANYATFAAYVEDIRTRLIAIVGDTGELQTDWADGGRLDLLIDAIKAKTDILPAANTDESGSFTWVTATHTTNEGDISALFSTDLTGTTRRRYAVFVDMTGPAADGAAWTCTVRVKIGFGVGDAYRTVDLKEIAKADCAAAKEPGINIDVPATAKNVQITLQFDVALVGDATIYYSYVKKSLE